MAKLKLEISEQLGKVLDIAEKSTHKIKGVTILVTPSIGEDYWAFRVKLSEKQAILGFPKFMTIGVGFAVEDDWNTNLPYSCDKMKIYNHIRCNQKVEGDKHIKLQDVVSAIELVQAAALEYKDAWKNL